MQRLRTAARAAVLSLVSAGLLVLAFPGPGLWPLAWVALAPLLLAVRGLPAWGAGLAGLAAGTAYQAAYGAWLLEVGVPVPSFALGALGCGLYVGVFGLTAWAIHRRAVAWEALAVPGAWVLLEYLRVHVGWLSAPWALLGHTQYTVLPVAGVAAVAGVWGVSFLLASSGLWICDGIERLRGRPVAITPGHVASVLVAAGLGLAAAWPVGGSDPASGGARVAVVQAGRHAAAARSPAEALQVFRAYDALTREAARAGADLVVWPESSVPASLPGDDAGREAVARMAREGGIHLLVASSGRDKAHRGTPRDQVANSVFLFAPTGEILDRYDKVRLLPFNEYAPWRSWMPWPSWVPRPPSDAAPGRRRTVFDVGGLRVGVLICWENLFAADVRRTVAGGVDLVVSMTNESFTPSATARRQLFSINVFRAIENGVPVARAATTGISAIVAPDGRVLRRVADAHGAELDVAGWTMSALPAPARPTPYRRWGDWFVAVAALAPGLAVAWPRRQP